MKTKALFITATVLMSINLMATKPKVEQTTENTEFGSLEEKTMFSNNVPYKKSIIKYNFTGDIQEKTMYQWNRYDSTWIPIHKRIFSRNMENQQLIIAYTEWNISKNNWDNDTEVSTYKQKSNSRILSMLGTKNTPLVIK